MNKVCNLLLSYLRPPFLIPTFTAPRTAEKAAGFFCFNLRLLIPFNSGIATSNDCFIYLILLLYPS